MSSPTTISSLGPVSGSGGVATKIFIDEVTDYAKLPKCAETRLSSIVRDMEFGCGDGSRMTSYACFCYDSSAYYDNMIRTQITSTCSEQSLATSAQGVFNQYCGIGRTRGLTPIGE